jgi:predicted aspartyl protease
VHNHKELFVQAELRNEAMQRTCDVALLFHTGFSGELLLSEQIAQQLKLTKKRSWRVHFGWYQWSFTSVCVIWQSRSLFDF